MRCNGALPGLSLERPPTLILPLKGGGMKELGESLGPSKRSARMARTPRHGNVPLHRIGRVEGSALTRQKRTGAATSRCIALAA